MWTVSTTPVNYHPQNGEGWCIIQEDGNIYNFYFSKQEAEEALKALIGVK